jgi:hypothetical protein
MANLAFSQNVTVDFWPKKKRTCPVMVLSLYGLLSSYPTHLLLHPFFVIVIELFWLGG